MSLERLPVRVTEISGAEETGTSLGVGLADGNVAGKSRGYKFGSSPYLHSKARFPT